MAPEAPRGGKEALLAQAREQAARLAAESRRREGLPPEPGDLFVLPATAELPVEWALLDRRADGRLLAVPLDAGPPAGTADVEVPEGEPGGPASLRCAYGLWLDAALFDPKKRSGILAPERVADALHRWRQAEARDLPPSPLAEEVDADPEYRDWSRDVLAPAKALASQARPVTVLRPRARTWGVPHQLAAALALVSLGLGLWVVQLQRKVEMLSEPIVDAPAGEVLMGEGTRGDDEAEVGPEATHIQLDIVFSADLEPGEGRLELSRGGRAVWSRQVTIEPGGDLHVLFSRDLLPNGEYRVRLYKGDRLLSDKPFLVKSAE